jgi:hypothetical protein
MLQLDEVVPGIVRLPDVPGNDGEFAVKESFPEIEGLLRDGQTFGLFLGATGCGKSKYLPAEYATLMSKHSCWGKLLVLTPAAREVDSMHSYCSEKNHPCHYRVGGDIQDGVPWHTASVIFATVGLASRWYANEGLSAFDDFGAVLLDEFGAVERNIEYSFLFEVMRKIQAQRASRGYRFFILMCTATMSDRLTEAMDLLCPSKIECPKRPYPLERYQVEMDSLPAMYEAMAKCAIALLRSGRTVLVFLPGQDEIGSVKERITSAGTGSKIR